MLHALPASEDLVLRYERMLERYLEVPLAVVCTTESTGLDPEHEAVMALVRASDGPVVSGDGETPPDPSLVALEIAAVAAWPLRDPSGRTIGALGVIDHEPRYWTGEDLGTIADLAEGCSGEMAHLRGRADAERQAQRAQELGRRSRVLLALSEGLSSTRTLDDIAFAVERVAVDQLECLHGAIWLLRTARDASDTDRLHHVCDPSGGWVSAAINADLPVTMGNPAGEVVLTGRSLVFATRAEQNARPYDLDLSRQVGETRVFMPLGLGRTFGVLALVWEGQQDLSAEHRVTIATLASYVSQAVQRAELLEERELVSTTLQAAMLPRLPQVSALELTARYRPAAARDRVGGDWYDAVVTHSGSTDVMIGDVSGHDIAAAAVMGEVRSMLRAFSFGHDGSPASNVAQLDQALDSFGIDRFASLLYVRAEQPDGTGQRRLSWTNAGHFPPLVVRPDGSAGLLEDPMGADLVLGVDATSERRDRTALVPEGSVLLLFTDGLVERRGECVTAGLRRLRDAAAEHHGKAPDALLDGLFADLVGEGNEDDVAVLAVGLTA
ncbi:hypothetical protein GCM10011519_20490 [Marmoricola endophyticus]|uniref:PPM-type phosphatase domain-containing protein n=1 Tax=Marmoricola endophyticus TaxID=2040280 RepID=A0A917F410_9ACTN|nr:GAF domain-containing SpoIIE family protein phosphatase [Marmoricola endophyticus]GGF46436.1 hypothetical protein GCM10011519_20490 [Marmoricola endophyticus]